MPQVLLKNESTFSYPDTWKCEEFDKGATLQGPEMDLIVHFMVLPKVEDALTQAWCHIQPQFNLNIAQQFALPSAWLGSYWESGQQTIYDVPLSESKTVMAYVRIYENQAYVSLVEATNAGLARRGAQLGQMMESWKPINALEQSLKDEEIRRWSQAQFNEFDQFVASSMDKLQIPGFAISIIKANGETLLSKGYGVKSVGSSQSVDTDTPFMIGSTTKPLTTFMMGAMVDQAKMTWDTPVCEILDTFKLDDPTLSQQMNARLTVSASTGMPRRDFDFIFDYSSPEERLKQMQQMKPTTALGETFQYSNLLFMVGGFMAAHAFAPQKPLMDAYAQSMQALVFTPLAMKNSTIYANEAKEKGAASPHCFDIHGKLTQIPLNIEQSCGSIAPSGAVWSTVNDMSQYLLAELNLGIVNKKRVMSEKVLLERRMPGIKMGDKSSYGLGLIINEEQGLTVISHGGGTMGFACDMFFYPEKGIGVVMMCNSRFGHAFLSAIKNKFLTLTFGAKPQAEQIIDISMSQQAEILRKITEDVSLEPEKLQWIKAYEGEYTNPYLKDAKITQTQDGFEITCKEWKSRLGAQCDQHGARYLVLLSPPFPGLLKLQAMTSGDLVLDAGQEQYAFKKKDQLTNAFSASILHAKKQFDNAQKIQPKDEKDKAYEQSARNRYH